MLMIGRKQYEKRSTVSTTIRALPPTSDSVRWRRLVNGAVSATAAAAVFESFITVECVSLDL